MEGLLWPPTVAVLTDLTASMPSCGHCRRHICLRCLLPEGVERPRLISATPLACSCLHSMYGTYFYSQHVHTSTVDHVHHLCAYVCCEVSASPPITVVPS